METKTTTAELIMMVQYDVLKNKSSKIRNIILVLCNVIALSCFVFFFLSLTEFLEFMKGVE